jgi:hypothetical protein
VSKPKRGSHRTPHLFGYVDAVHHLAWLAAEDARGPEGDDHVAALLDDVAEQTDDSRRSGDDHVDAYLHAAADLLDLVSADTEDLDLQRRVDRASAELRAWARIP